METPSVIVTPLCVTLVKSTGISGGAIVGWELLPEQSVGLAEYYNAT